VIANSWPDEDHISREPAICPFGQIGRGSEKHHETMPYWHSCLPAFSAAIISAPTNSSARKHKSLAPHNKT
jgi:hypothetical protein